MHLLLGVIRTLRGYDNNKDESDSYRRCGAQAEGSSAAAQERPFHCRVSFFLLAFLRAWPLSNPACYFTCAACLLLGHIFEWTRSHSQQLEKRLPSKNVIKKNFMSTSCRLTKILLKSRTTTHWKVEFLISFSGVSDAKM